MIELFAFVSDQIKEIDVSDIKKFRRSKVWVRCVNPTESELPIISNLLALSTDELKDALEEVERPKLEKTHLLEIIYSIPHVEDDELITRSVHIYLYKNILLTIEDVSHHIFEKISTNMKKNQNKFLFRRGMGYFIFYIIDQINDDFLRHIDSIAHKVDFFEEKGFISIKNMDIVYDASVSLTYFNRALIANLEVLNALRKSYFKSFTDDERELFGELYHDALQIIDTGTIQRETISNLFNLQTLIQTARLNRFIKKLTSLALIIMAPTLVTGIYGMNFANLPLAQHAYGFHIMLGLMLLITFVLLFVFIKIDWL